MKRIGIFICRVPQTLQLSVSRLIYFSLGLHVSKLSRIAMLAEIYPFLRESIKDSTVWKYCSVDNSISEKGCLTELK